MSKFFVHDNVGLRFQDGSYPSFGKNTSKFQDVEGKLKSIVSNKNGKRVAWIIDGEVRVFEGPEWKKIGTLQHPKAQDICFSPQGNYLAILDTYTQLKGASPPLNMSVYSVTERKLMKAFTQRTQSDWQPQWTDDEGVMARMSTSEVHFYKGNDLETSEHKKTLAKVKSYSLSPSSVNHHVTFFVPSLKGAPAYVQMFKYPAFKEPGQAVANKSFFKVDTVENFWNPQCTAVLMLTTAEVDKSGTSYYGEQMLFYLNSKGDSNRVTFSKQGNIRSVCWTKTGKEFFAVYGYAPAKATLFNLKCDPIKEFGEGARNIIMVNPTGNLAILGAMGNISSRFEVWDIVNTKLIGGQEVPDTTHMEWSPCGQNILTSTCSPRLRVHNGYKIWHYSGSLLHEKLYPDGSELYRASWVPDEQLSQQTFNISTKVVKGIKSQSTQASKERYIPPSQRLAAATLGNTVDTTKRFLSQREDPVPVKLEETEKNEKNKKKKEAAKVKKEEAKKKKEEQKGMDKDWREERPPTEPLEEQPKKNKKKKKKPATEEVSTNGEAPQEESNQSAEAQNEQSEPVNKTKKIRALKKKLDSIQKLKEDFDAGKKLDKDQMVKMESEQSVIEDMKRLTVT